MNTDQPTVSYRERLRVPVAWWLLGLGFLLSLWVAVIVAVPGPIAFAISGVALAGLSAAFWSYGDVPVVVDSHTLTAGRARLPRCFVGEVTELDRETTRQLLGAKADARAYLLTRPYVATAVRVELTDPADPTPYWVVATRHPARLAAALTASSADRPVTRK